MERKKRKKSPEVAEFDRRSMENARRLRELAAARDEQDKKRDQSG